MKFYYYCMDGQYKDTIVGLVNLCAGKASNNEIDKLREEKVNMFEITECPVSNDIERIFVAGHYFHSLRSDGTVWNIDGTRDETIPSVKNIEAPLITKDAWYRGRDGKVYDGQGNEQTEEALCGFDLPFGKLQKDGEVWQLLTTDGKPYVVPLARLKEMDTEHFKRNTLEWMRKHYGNGYNPLQELQKGLVEIKSDKMLFGTDGTCLFSWNGLTYSVVPNGDMYGLRMVDAAYREEYDLDDIMQLVADKIYINYKGKLVFMDGWNDYTDARLAKFDERVIKAQKWENLTHCEVLGKHLVAKTKDGRILTTFEPDICGDLKSIDYAFVSEKYAFFTVR